MENNIKVNMQAAKEEIYDLIIIGSGPAGLSASIYANRAMLKTKVIEENYLSGGQVLTTSDVDNYLGFSKIGGYDLSIEFRKHAEQLGADFLQGRVNEVKIVEDGKNPLVVVSTDKGEFIAKAILVTTGAQRRLLGVSGEDKLKGAGVSYCANCDGAFFRKRVVAVVGGGDTAVEEAEYLSNVCEKVYLIHRREELAAAKSYVESVARRENIEVLYNTKINSINGEQLVNSITIENLENNKVSELKVDGVFVAIGTIPNSRLIKDIVELDKSGYVVAGENGVTSNPCIFVAGDVRTKELRQIVTAVSDGATAVDTIVKYLNRQVW